MFLLSFYHLLHCSYVSFLFILLFISDLLFLFYWFYQRLVYFVSLFKESTFSLFSFSIVFCFLFHWELFLSLLLSLSLLFLLLSLSLLFGPLYLLLKLHLAHQSWVFPLFWCKYKFPSKHRFCCIPEVLIWSIFIIILL